MENPSPKLQAKINAIKESDTYQAYKDLVDTTLEEAQNEEEFVDMLHNSLQDWADQAHCLQNLLK